MTLKAAPVREHLSGVACNIVRAKGFSGTSVDELCRAAGVTKDAFFIISKARNNWALRLPIIGRKRHQR